MEIAYIRRAAESLHIEFAGFQNCSLTMPLKEGLKSYPFFYLKEGCKFKKHGRAWTKATGKQIKIYINLEGEIHIVKYLK